MSAPLQGTASAATAIQRLNYSHDAMIDLIIARPNITQNEIAAVFGYTPAWVSRVKNSDAFLERLAARKADLVDPSLLANLDEKFRAIADRSADVVMEKLSAAPTFDMAMKALTESSKALGYGARKDNVSVQNNFVVALPAKAESAQTWVERHAGGNTIDMPATAT